MQFKSIYKNLASFFNLFIFFTLILSGFCCKKLVEVNEPVDTIVSSETFSTEANAVSAVIGIYNNMINSKNALPFSAGGVTIYTGLSSDELKYSLSNVNIQQFGYNTLLKDNYLVKNVFWSHLYFDIYMANAVIEGLNVSTTISTEIKDQLIGEAKFLRAFCYFYLVNLFGDIPLVTTTGWATTATLSRTSSTKAYELIIQDLNEAGDMLPGDYKISGGNRVRVNKYAAKALLARVYLYTSALKNAELLSTSVIENANFYTLSGDLKQTFLKNSPEAIWQLEVNSSQAPYATWEGNLMIPELLTKDYPSGVVQQYWNYFVPTYYLSNELISAFEPNDLRKKYWTDSTGNLNGVNYYYPYKYKVRIGASGNVSEYYTPLRLAEQFLIRAEARTLQNKLTDAVADINIIRARAGLPDLSNTLTQSEILNAIERERKIEFLGEWGHRWLDLKRWGKAEATLGPIKGAGWQKQDQLYPIPFSDLQTNPNLTQNDGY